jgi:hypothetical protein
MVECISSAIGKSDPVVRLSVFIRTRARFLNAKLNHMLLIYCNAQPLSNNCTIVYLVVAGPWKQIVHQAYRFCKIKQRSLRDVLGLNYEVAFT